MRVAVCSAQSYDRQFFTAANHDIGHELVFFDSHLCYETRQMVGGFPAVCVFVNDSLDARVLETLVLQGTQLIALRCAGFNNVDIQAASSLGLRIVRVPAYSPHSVAEHSVGLMLVLNRHLHQAYNRVRNGNVTQILHGFGCRLLAHDPQENGECTSLGVEYVALEKLYAERTSSRCIAH